VIWLLLLWIPVGVLAVLVVALIAEDMNSETEERSRHPTSRHRDVTVLNPPFDWQHDQGGDAA